MAEPAFEYALPDSGEIRLSQIKAEFNKGNNLTAYCGSVAGVPNAPPIKVTDFYGKSAELPPTAPNGVYSGAHTHWRTTDPNNIGAPQFDYINLGLCDGNGGGYPSSWGNRAGVRSGYTDAIETGQLMNVTVEGNSAGVNNSYGFLVVAPRTGQNISYPGSWTFESLDNVYDVNSSNPVINRIDHTYFSNMAAAQYLWEYVKVGAPFELSLQNTRGESLLLFKSEGEEK